ncbi:hypothetical protein UA08_01749 [Talaromyces atroroseus]|uniref:Uncharacterized protein n=1 Tax=Talaromyces atroroseus TaxID=1441469 RepID=A0A1Q5QAC1_TALAT|nr:hypothetical protein UA08_01749 [Talaromyces atroroseus]OKL62893.1 hypothetical protein UA08_01749 [Talaromyces atroroseus]
MAWKPITLALALSLANTSLADVYFGSLSGDDLNSGLVCNYIAWLGGSDPCNAGNWPPADNTGSCPGGNNEAPNFCGGGLGGVGCPSDFQLDSSDDCGAAWTALGDSSPAPSAGTFYANVIDVADNNAIVGRYTLLWEPVVHCYMDSGVGC